MVGGSRRLGPTRLSAAYLHSTDSFYEAALLLCVNRGHKLGPSSEDLETEKDTYVTWTGADSLSVLQKGVAGFHPVQTSCADY